jgi:DNA-binding transcriptional ArsR family regulator/uncharacterized protein YndB with AHSA1/START domain
MNDDVWRALADPTRRALLDLLRDAPRTTGELAAAFPDVTRFAVMKHLGVLADAGLVVVRRRGRERWNHLNAVPLRQAYERWMAPFAERAAVTSLRLKDFVEGRTMDLDVANEVTINAPPERVYDALLRIGQWWPHRFRDGAEVVLEPFVGGRFYESWGGDTGALYGTVARLERPVAFAVSGPMGMAGPVSSVWSMTLSPAGGGTSLALAHRAFGDIDDETRAAYTSGWGEVVAALRAAVSSA